MNLEILSFNNLTNFKNENPLNRVIYCCHVKNAEHFPTEEENPIFFKFKALANKFSKIKFVICYDTTMKQSHHFNYFDCVINTNKKFTANEKGLNELEEYLMAKSNFKSKLEELKTLKELMNINTGVIFYYRPSIMQNSEIIKFEKLANKFPNIQIIDDSPIGFSWKVKFLLFNINNFKNSDFWQTDELLAEYNDVNKIKNRYEIKTPQFKFYQFWFPPKVFACDNKGFNELETFLKSIKK